MRKLKIELPDNYDKIIQNWRSKKITTKKMPCVNLESANSHFTLWYQKYNCNLPRFVLYFKYNMQKEVSIMYGYTLLNKLNFIDSIDNLEPHYTHKPELMTTFDELHQKTSSLIDENYQPLQPIGFLSEADLRIIAKANIERIYDKIPKYAEIDTFYQINFTCDYYLKRIPTKFNCVYDYIDDASEYWYDDLNIERKTDKDYASSFIKNCSSFKSPFPKLIEVTEAPELGYHYVRVPALCSQFSMYIFENLINTPWYINEKRLYDRYLLSNFLDIERCQFEDSDYYIFEQLTNINSVMTISNFLYKILSKEESELLKTNLLNKSFSRELDMLIQACAQSPLIFSKSIILQILFDDASKTFDPQRELAYLLRYVCNQFAEINTLLTDPSMGINGAVYKFAQYFIESENSIDKNILHIKKQEYIRNLKKAPKIKYTLSNNRFKAKKDFKNISQAKKDIEDWAHNMVIFKEIQKRNLSHFDCLKRYFIDDNLCFEKDSLVKDTSIMSIFEKSKTANQISSNINAYVQKKFLEHLNSKHST